MSERISSERISSEQVSSPSKRNLWSIRTLRDWLGQRDLVLMLIIAVVAGGAWLFVELAAEVLEGDTASFDEAALLALRNPQDLLDPLGPKWMEEALRDFTALGGAGVSVLLTVGVVGLLYLQERRSMALYVVLAVASGVVISVLLKELFDRPRPDLVPHGSYVVTASFPSGHSMISAVTFLTLGALVARLQQRRSLQLYILSIAVLITFLVGFSRVYLGVHWPTDVLGGWAAGAVWALLCMGVARWLQLRGDIEPSGKRPS